MPRADQADLKLKLDENLPSELAEDLRQVLWGKPG